MSEYKRENAFIAAFVVMLTVFLAPVAVQADSGNVVLWNKLGSTAEVANSEIGPNGLIHQGNSSIEYLPVQFGNGMRVNGDGNNPNPTYVLFNVNSIPSYSGNKGTMAFWVKPNHNSNYGNNAIWTWVDKNEPFVAAIYWRGWEHSIWFQICALPFNCTFNEGIIKVYNSQFSFSAGDVFQVALVWDRSGIDGTSNTIRAYINGKLYGTRSDSWNSNLRVANILIGANYAPPLATLDNLVLYDVAKTDFSDRFDESPIPASPFCKGKLSAKVTTNGFVYSRSTKTYHSNVTVKNTGTQYVNGPVSVVFANLPTGVSLVNPSGTSLGSPYAVIPSLSAAPDVFAPNQTVSFPVQFNATAPINFSNTVCSGGLNP